MMRISQLCRLLIHDDSQYAEGIDDEVLGRTTQLAPPLLLSSERRLALNRPCMKLQQQ